MIPMSSEAVCIEQLLAQHRADCRVIPPPHSYESSTLRVYRLDRRPGIPLRRVTRLGEELDEALTLLRRSPVHCRFDRMPLRLEVPRPDPQPLLLRPTLQQLESAGLPAARLLSLAGESQRYGKQESLLLDFSNPSTPHLLVAGTTGSGKTSLLLSLILSLAALNGPERLGLAVLDPKGVDLVGLSRLPHLVAPLATDPGDAVDVLRAVVAEMGRRQTAGSRRQAEQRQAAGGRRQADTQRSVGAQGHDFTASAPTDPTDLVPDAGGRQQAEQIPPALVVVIDELAELMDVAGKEVEASLKRILQIGRGLGIHVIGATQKPLAGVIGSLVKANFPVRMVGKVTSSEDARVATGLSNTQAERLPGMGSFLLVQGGHLRKVQSYYIPQNETAAEVERIRQKWRDVDGSWHLRATPPPLQPVIAGRNATANGGYPRWLRGSVEAFLRENGKLPSQRAVQRTYQEETGRMLKWETIRDLLAEFDRA